MLRFGEFAMRATGSPSVKYSLVFVRSDAICTDNVQKVSKDIQAVHDFIEYCLRYLKTTPAVFLRNDAVVTTSRLFMYQRFALQKNIVFRTCGFLIQISQETFVALKAAPHYWRCIRRSYMIGRYRMYDHGVT